MLAIGAVTTIVSHEYHHRCAATHLRHLTPAAHNVAGETLEFPRSETCVGVAGGMGSSTFKQVSPNSEETGHSKPSVLFIYIYFNISQSGSVMISVMVTILYLELCVATRGILTGTLECL